MLTDKNKEQFEKWYKENISIDLNQKLGELAFYNIAFEMQIGVYLAYYDSLDYAIDVYQEPMHEIESIYYGYEILNNYRTIFSREDYKSRNEAYKEAFKKANSIVNNN